MPNRIIKESICTSESVDQLSWFEEVTFYRLIVNCDDFGRMDGRPAILRGRLFPLKAVTEKNLVDAINKLSTVGLVIPYEYDGKPILQLATWDKHQTVRNKRSKYPAVNGKTDVPVSENIALILQMKSNEITCNQMQANVPVIQSNTIQSESNPNTNPILPGAETAPDQQQEKPTIHLLLNDGTQYPIFQQQVKEWSALFPGVDVEQELRNMVAWCVANPTRRKTKSGVMRFITSWLTKEQNKAKGPARSQSPASERHYGHPSDFIREGEQ